MEHLLRLDKISCRYDGHPVVNDFSFSVEKGDICCLLGPSGCGKTTVLRSIAGFQELVQGRIILDGNVISTPENRLPPEQRRIGMVFQDYALFPHLTIRDNIAFGLHNKSTAEKQKICNEVLSLVKLEGMESRYPHELSGGQQQRVALARALAPRPRLLLMDEPFSSLDVELRKNLSIEVREILKSLDITAIMVTHDQEEAFAFSDKIGVVHNGRIEQWSKPFDLYHEPASRFVAQFIGKGVLLPGKTTAENTIVTELGAIPVDQRNNLAPDMSVEVVLRPDNVIHEADSPEKAQIINKVFAGASTLYTLRLSSGGIVTAALASHYNYPMGDFIRIKVQIDHPVVFRCENG